MRLLIALLAFFLVGAKPADWLNTLSATPQGGFVMGNPNARVKIVEFASLTCSHCRDFHLAASPELGPRYISKGLVSYEIRTFVLNAPDLAAATLARCQGPRRFFALLDAFYRSQSQWLQPFGSVPAAERTRISALPETSRPGALAVAGKLDQFVARHGMTRPVAAKCLADEALVNQVVAIREAHPEVNGTPTFLINGVRTDAGDWPSLKSRLDAALK